MNLLLNEKHVFKMFLIRLKCFYDSLNIVAILDPGRELFSNKCAQFPLTFKE